MQKIKSVIWGLAIISLGVIFGGNALGLFDINIFFKGWWALFLIVPGLIGFITEKEKLGNLTFAGAGVILLLAAQDVFSWDTAWKIMLAIFFIAIGLSLIYKNIFHQKKNKEMEEAIKKSKNDNHMDSQAAVFSGNDRVYNNEEFPGSEVLAVFGGANLDLRTAIIKKDTYIKVFCLFGGVEIEVPDDIQIKSKSGFIFGGISDNRKSKADKSKYTIYIEAAGGFGGVTINDTTSKKDKK